MPITVFLFLLSLTLAGCASPPEHYARYDCAGDQDLSKSMLCVGAGEFVLLLQPIEGAK